MGRVLVATRATQSDLDVLKQTTRTTPGAKSDARRAAA